MTDRGVTRGTRLSDYDYDLPPELVASYPTDRRDQSKLLVVSRSRKIQRHFMFRDLVDLFRSGDVLVVNETKVIPSRLVGRKPTGAHCEVLLLKPWTGSITSSVFHSNLGGVESFSEVRVWEALVRPGKKLKPGRIVQVGDDLHVEILDILPGGNRLVRLISEDTLEKALEKHGRMPLPPYLNREEEPLDRDRYQTVYSKKLGSVAAPTAGLHFTPNLLDEIDLKGVQRVPITLDVGVGTFRPVGVAELENHHMHTESYLVPISTAEIVNKAKSEGRRIWAVGTTVVRTLESAEKGGVVRPGPGETDLFIRPPQECIMIDGLITNFHLPRSTLMMLVASFCGYETLRRAYGEAIRKRYRFYSYGDAMVIE
ncbi:MAG TPA: tRNA preQ1(34) S-adenosylmethionine ribosyltransferase-isomerase QueA [Gemmatimonadetes bacterium]|nr:tRNA preQ1(34) S-adenosylmethionine ribosyltransferase-isomerase QueA [Gemmatimonadota bacterium]